GTVTGVVNGDATTASFSSAVNSTSNVGNYTITAALNDPTSKLGNYTVTSNTGTLIITRTALSVTANDKSRLYGAVNPALDGTLVGVVAGDNISPSFATAATLTTGVGAVPITATLNDSGNRLGNYSVTNNPGTLTINKAHLMVTARDATRAYGAANPAEMFTVTGFQNNETPVTANVAGS